MDHIKFLICANNSDSAMAEAKFVESDSGDVLSPKIAPEMIAPATNAGLKPIVVPIPNRAIPIVEMIVNALPMEVPMMAQTRKTDGTNHCAEIKWKPKTIMDGIIPAAIQTLIKAPISKKIKMGIIPVLIPSIMPS